MSQDQILELVRTEPGIEAIVVVERLEAHYGTVSRQIFALEKKGLIRKAYDGKKSRRLVLYPAEGT